MTVTAVERDAEALTLTITSEFDATVEQAWQLWANPRLLEKWWGPPMYPATFVDHDLTPGGRVSYYMTGPAGDQPRGWWRVLVVDAPRSLELEDGFADEDGNENPDLPVTKMRAELVAIDGNRTRMAVRSTFPSLAAMEQMLAMMVEEGMTQAMDQIDEVLAAAFAGS